MSVLTLQIEIDSSETDGNPTSWQWLVDSNAATTNPPPRMQVNDSLQIQVTDSNGSTSLDAYMVMGPKVENPLTGVTGSASPLRRGDSNTGAVVCVATWSGIGPSSSSGVFTFTPPDSVFMQPGAWELTFVISCPALVTEFELDPEFDVSN